MARLQQTQRKRVGSVPRLPVDVVAAIAAEERMSCPLPGRSSNAFVCLRSTWRINAFTGRLEEVGTNEKSIKPKPRNSTSSPTSSSGTKTTSDNDSSGNESSGGNNTSSITSDARERVQEQIKDLDDP
ncbi:hypothetical protein AgCh_025077 [Apium graveolens]